MLGMAYAATYRPRPAYDGTRETSVYVAAEARGRGLGRALYDELLGRVDADGIHVCLAVIAQPNPASEALHAAVGFEHVGTLREVGRKFDRWVDTAWWQRPRAGPRPGPAALGPGLGWAPWEQPAQDLSRTTTRSTSSTPRRPAARGPLGPGPRGARRGARRDRLRRGAGHVRGGGRGGGRGGVGEPRGGGGRAVPATRGWPASRCPTDDEELVEKSRQVLRRAVRSHDNEWWELWDEAGLADDVRASCRRALAWLGDRDD